MPPETFDDWGALSIIAMAFLTTLLSIALLVPLLINLWYWRGAGRLSEIRWAAVLTTAGWGSLSGYLCVRWADIVFFDLRVLGPADERWRLLFFIFLMNLTGAFLYLRAYWKWLRHMPNREPAQEESRSPGPPEASPQP